MKSADSGEEGREGVSRDLGAALAAMSFEVVPGRFALLGTSAPPTAEELRHLGEGPGQLVIEGGETTWLVAEAGAQELLALHPEARVERGLAWLRFVAPMGWEVVGFLAKVTGSLAAAGVPLGAVCGFSRDHLFVHEEHLERTLEVLRARFPQRTS